MSSRKFILKILVLFSVSVLVQKDAFSQVQHEHAFDFTLGGGSVVRNYPEFPSPKNTAMVSSVKYAVKLNGSKPWHRYYRFPFAGLRLTFGALGNKAVLGNFISLTGEYAWDKKINESWSVTPELGMGASWFSRPFNEKDNPENVVIGSAVTFMASAAVRLNYKVRNNLGFFLQGGILHASNSHFKLPNVGMNLPLVSLGTSYSIIRETSAVLDTLLPEYSGRIRLNIKISLGINEQGASAGPVNGPKYLIYLGSVYASKKISPVNKLTAGFEAWYNTGAYDFIVSQDFYTNHRQQKAMSAAICLGHEFLMGHVSFITTGGIYVYNPFFRERLKRNDINGVKDKLKALIPLRIGLQYSIKDGTLNENSGFYAGVYIKTNFGQADFLETGIGYGF